MKNLKSLVAAEAVHPGEHLADELKARFMTQAELAKLMGKPRSRISELIMGKAGINAEMALALEKALQIEALWWLNLQARYEVAKLRLAQLHKQAA